MKSVNILCIGHNVRQNISITRCVQPVFQDADSVDASSRQVNICDVDTHSQDLYSSSTSSDGAQEELTESNFDKYILKEFIKLYGMSSMSQSTTDWVIGLIITIVNIIFDSMRSVKNIENLDLFISNTLYTLERFKSVAKIKLYLQRKNIYTKPSKFLVENNTVQVIGEDNVYFENVESNGMVLPIKEHLSKFLELPGVLNDITNYRDSILERKVEGQYGHFLHGRKWQTISSKYEGKNLIPITLYTDDFQVDDKSGPHSSTNSIAAFYYQIACLPPHLMSKIEYIFVALLAHAKDLKVHSPDSAMYTLVEIFTELEKDGLLIKTGNGNSHRVHFILCNAVGDNLGLHMMCSLILGFNASYFCRFCNAHLHETKTWTQLPDNIQMKTISEYTQILSSEGEKYGIVREAILNSLPSFHVMANFTADIMHDLLLGTFKYELKHLFFAYTSTLKTLKLDALNELITKHGKVEGFSGIIEIKVNHLKASTLQLNAREVMFLVQHLPLILPNPSTEIEEMYYKFGLRISFIWEKCYQSFFDDQRLNELSALISKHLAEYKQLFKDTLKPKHHFLLHYSDVIKQSGPLRYVVFLIK